MKIRDGFVSNSSSSSFIIARSKTLSAKTHITIEIDLADKAEDVLNTVEDVEVYIQEKRDDYCDEDYVNELRNKMLKAIKNGEVIYLLEIEYHEPEHQAMIEDRLNKCVVLNSEDF